MQGWGRGGHSCQSYRRWGFACRQVGILIFAIRSPQLCSWHLVNLRPFLGNSFVVKQILTKEDNVPSMSMPTRPWQPHFQTWLWNWPSTNHSIVLRLRPAKTLHSILISTSRKWWKITCTYDEKYQFFQLFLFLWLPNQYFNTTHSLNNKLRENAKFYLRSLTAPHRIHRCCQRNDDMRQVGSSWWEFPVSKC